MTATVPHSPACEQVLREWLSHPADSVEHRLADFARMHTDAATRDLLLTVFDEDHGTDAEQFARALWPTLVVFPPDAVDADAGETVEEYGDDDPDAEPAPITATCDACGGTGDTGADWCEECQGCGRLDVRADGIFPHESGLD